MALNPSRRALDLALSGKQGLPGSIESQWGWVKEGDAHHLFPGTHEMAWKVLQPCLVAPKLVLNWELIEVK